MTTEGKLPVVDLSTPDEQQVAAELVNAFKTIGFATLTNHGVDSAVIDSAFAASKSFFDLSVETKMRYKYQGHLSNRGYIPYEAENHFAETVKPDKKETYDIGTQSEKDFETPWPNELPSSEFKDILLRYYDEFNGVYLRLCRLLAMGLGMKDSDFFSRRSDEQHCNLRLLHYPQVEKDPDDTETIVRGARHTDFGTLTLLTQDGTGGLRVQRADGSWIFVPPVPGSIIVNVGDMLQRWTNDVLPSTPHQVVNLSNHADTIPERYSIAFFCNANKDVMLECLEEVSKEPAKYSPINALQYLTQRLTETISNQ